MNYKERSEELAREQMKYSPHYTYLVWASPKDDLEKDIIEFVKNRHPQSITVTLQTVVDDIREFHILWERGLL